MKKKQKHYSGKELLYHRALEQQKKQETGNELSRRLKTMNNIKEAIEKAKKKKEVQN